MTKYFKISGGFMIGAITNVDEYSGAAVACAEGFYLVFSTRQLGQTIGKIQGAMADAAGPYGDRLVRKDEKSFNCQSIWHGSYDELPATVTEDPEWPVVKNPKDVWFIPMDAVDQVKVSIWYGVKVRAGEAQFNFPVGVFSQKRVQEGLRDLGCI